MKIFVSPLWAKITRGTELRNFSESFTQYGRQKWESVLQRAFRKVPNVPIHRAPIPQTQPSLTRQVFAGLFPRVAWQTLAADLRRRAALQLMSGGWMRTGRSVPLFAFVGLVFSTPKQDEKDELFEKIRELHTGKDFENTVDNCYSLGGLEFRRLIAKGCNAAVYEARLKTTADSEKVCEDTESDISVIDEEETSSDLSMAEEEGSMSDISIIEEEGFVSDISFINEEGSTSDINIIEEEGFVSDISFINEEGSTSDISLISEEGSTSDISFINEEEPLNITEDEGSESDYSAINDLDSEKTDDIFWPGLTINLLPFDPGEARGREDEQRTSSDFDLAVKVMFNYDAESNAEAVLRAMEKEVVPISTAADFLQQDMWHNGNHAKKKAWPTHPNIVRMYGLFVDWIPDLPDNIQHYPAALPSRIYPDGLGRNMTMFVIMQRYSCTLTDYLTQEQPCMRTRCALLCQLLEGLLFLRQLGVAHRDIKSDNLLLDLAAGSDWPQLVISDFGCCLDEDTLQIPYTTREIPKGGNSALMAPEIAGAVAGPRAVLDYRKSDVWAAGALAYEIMGSPNPFYCSKKQPTRLDSRTYREEDLPALPEAVPDVVKKLTRNLLSRDTSKRVSAAVAATVMQLHLSGVPDNTRDVRLDFIQNWTVSLAAKVSLNRLSRHTESSVANRMTEIFLSRISYQDLKGAVEFLQTV